MILFGQNVREQEKEAIFATLLERLDLAVASFDYERNKAAPGNMEEPEHTLGSFYASLITLALSEQYHTDNNGCSTYAYNFFHEVMRPATEDWARTSLEEQRLLLMEFVVLHVWPRIQQLLAEEVRQQEARAVNLARGIEETPTLGVQNLLFPQHQRS